MRFSATSLAEPSHPPLLGEHTDAVLTQLGYSKEQIAKMHKDKIV